jgi:hypothetical protein
MADLSIRTAVLVPLLLLAARVDAQARITISRAVSNNNSDNSGINIGGSQVAGNTFGPTNWNAGSGNRSPIANNPTGASLTIAVAGGTVSTTGFTSNVAPTAGSMDQVIGSLSSGTVTTPTASGGTLTITMSPQVGRTLAAMLDAQTTTSWPAYVAARIATVNMLMSLGVDPATANAVASALANAAEARAALRPVGRPTTPPTRGPAAPADAAVYGARAVASMSSAIQIYMTEQPGTPLPAPILAAAVIVSAAARQTLPLPSRLRSTGPAAPRK